MVMIQKQQFQIDFTVDVDTEHMTDEDMQKHIDKLSLVISEAIANDKVANFDNYKARLTVKFF